MECFGDGSVTCASTPKEPRAPNLAPATSQPGRRTRRLHARRRHARAAHRRAGTHARRRDRGRDRSAHERRRPAGSLGDATRPDRDSDTTASNALEAAHTTSTTNATTTRSTVTPTRVRFATSLPVRYLTFPSSLPFRATDP